MGDRQPRPSNGFSGPSARSTGAGGTRASASQQAGGRDVSQSRPSMNGGPGYGKQPRGSMSQLAGGPRQSSSGVRRSYRQSSRRSGRSGVGGDGGASLQILDDDGVDRTPKPLMTLKPSVLKGMQGGLEENATPGSDPSDFFMDRMSSAGFSRGGWYSGNNSGTITPKSEADDDYEIGKGKATAAADGAPVPVEMGDDADDDKPGQGGALGLGANREQQAAEPEMLMERDLEKMVYITLQETATVFLHETACITVAADSEGAKAVEDSNKRYGELLAAKQSTDRYSDVEAQTINLLSKNREVQSAVLMTSAAGCQATTWDISDTYRAIEEASAEADDGGMMQGLPTVSQLAGAVSKGEAYRTGGSGNAGGNSSQRTTATMNGLMHSSSMTRDSVMGRNTWATASTMYGTVQGMLPDGRGSMPGVSADGSSVAGPGQEGSGDGPGEPMAAPNPLATLRGLSEALQLMDMAVTQNLYLPKLLTYRNIQALAAREPAHQQHAAAVQQYNSQMTHRREADADSVAARSAVGGPSRPLSRSHSRNNMSDTASMVDGRGGSGGPNVAASVAGMLAAGLGSLSQGGGGTGTVVGGGPGGAGAGPGAGYAASMAESAWPEELLQDLADLGPDAVPHMEQLWEWVCPLTTGANVSCMGWNKARPDLLAVGYGSSSFASGADFGNGARGMVAFWSLKNPTFPLWWFETTSGVTALDFATQSPNILAVGLYDGTVSIYDVKSRQGTPSMESDATTGRHSDPIWKVKWLDRGQERDEPLISISTDGRVTQWSIAKGLEFADIMKLKRVPRKQQTGPVMGGSKTTPGGAAAAAATAAAGEHDAFISRLTSGMSFDFSARDERIYIAGTEDGWIHKCSTSYSEQYLESYQGHMGPVYQVQWSPFKKDMFISASGDWTLRLWQEGRENALLMFQSSNQEVNDVQWCPTNATVFGSVTSGGRLEIWDFDLSTVKPVITHKAGLKLSCMLFSPNSPIVVCGGENGSVSVFRLFNVEREYDTVDEQLSRLEDVIRQNVMKQQAGAANNPQ